MTKGKIITSEPWDLPASKGKGRNVQRGSLEKRKASAGGGDNPARVAKNRNPSGSKEDPTIKGAPNRSRTVGGIAKLGNDPLKSRNPSGNFKEPKISTKEPKKRSYK